MSVTQLNPWEYFLDLPRVQAVMITALYWKLEIAGRALSSADTIGSSAEQYFSLISESSRSL